MTRSLCIAACVLSLACSSQEEPAPGAGGEGGETSCEGRGNALEPDLVWQAADGVEVQLLALEPEAPVVGDNTWRVGVTRAGEALAGARLSVVPWMPDHRHASTKVVRVSEAEAGSYVLSPVYLGMLGYWEVGITIELNDEELGSVSLDLCLSRGP